MYDSVHGYSATVPNTVPALMSATISLVPPEPHTWRSLPGVIPSSLNAVSAPAVIWSPNEQNTWMFGFDWKYVIAIRCAVGWSYSPGGVSMKLMFVPAKICCM